MTAMNVGPCDPWDFICEDFPDDPTVEQQEKIDDAVMIATEVLWSRTKRRFGTCQLTLRPCRRDCWPSSYWGTWSPFWQNASGWGWPFPALVGGQWINLACGACGDNCSCSVVHEVRLPYPVAEINAVTVDGVVLAPAAYRVDDWRYLIRLDGEEWPRCNDLNLADTEVGTWSVNATYGYAVPITGKRAVGQLASEIFKACPGSGGGSCLPASTVTQVTRQGVTKIFFDANTAFKRGKIGLYWPDLFIATYNPSGTGMASIYDIDGPRQRRVGT